MPSFIKNAYNKTSDEVLSEVDSRANGLSQQEAKERLALYGLNRLPQAAQTSVGKVFLRQFLNPLIYILLFVGILSLFLQHYSDAGFIFGVLILNALIGTAQEYQAEKSAIALRQITKFKCTVIRDGENFDIDSSQITIGDIVFLESGAKTPADLRLISTQGLKVDESLLTGESLPVEKNAQSVLDAQAILGDQVNMVFAGTIIARGRAYGIVTATGINTELGKIAEAVFKHAPTKTPLIIRMEVFTQKLSILFSIAVVIISVLLFTQGESIINVLILAVALGVAAIPEGLPVALTVALATASRRMAKKNVIVRALSSVEALGSCTFICTDKTGTLTVNELTVKTIALPYRPTLQITGSGVVPEGKVEYPTPATEMIFKSDVSRLAQTVTLCNDGILIKRDGEWHTHGDAVDVALLVFAHKLGITAPNLFENYKILARIPYESELQFAATLHRQDGQQILSVKGAAERVLPMCDSAYVEADQLPIDLDALEKQSKELASQGYRVIAIAAGKPKKDISAPLESSHLTNLTFLGFIGMIDPLRPDAKNAIQASRQAGVEVAMITGDHPITSFTIARELDLIKNLSEVVTGENLKKTQSIEELDALIKPARVFARIEPQQKLDIVQSLIRQGHFVAVTGDGVNDAPALKAAHVGVAMGKNGTDVARETADLIIADDKFSSLVTAIEEGRVAYANIRKVIYLLLSTGIGEIVLIVLSMLSGLPMPFTAVQLLWLNLVTEGIQDVALAFEKKEGDELQKPPRPPNEPIFNRLMIERVALSALVMGGVGYWEYNNLLASGISHSQAQNSILLLMVLFENIMVGNARSETNFGFKINPLRNPFLLLGTLGAQLLHVGALHIPVLEQILGTSPVTVNTWLRDLLLATSVFLIIELHKWFWRWRKRP